MSSLQSFYQGKKVLVTGHTGFKGSWLSWWLHHLGACVHGFSLPPPTTPSHYSLSNLSFAIKEKIADIQNKKEFFSFMQKVQPHIVFHLAAEPIVLHSFENPLHTYSVNVTGSLHVLEAVRQLSSAKALVVITTDKVYENNETGCAYIETDRLGAHDPYSTSKAMVELLTSSYIKSYPNMAATATARAGNVYGGADFAPHRLVPDCMQALLKDKPILLRNPASIRPWTYVLDPLYGYLLLAQKLAESKQYQGSWNFGPQEQEPVTCEDVARLCIKAFGKGSLENAAPPLSKKEMKSLRLNHKKATDALGWTPRYSIKEGLSETLHWYRQHAICKNNSSQYRELVKCAFAGYRQKQEEASHALYADAFTR